ncbi:hypothetical protein BLOT_012520 [Blomia tropicalis]|nr:hypothetical protein BLOT_012520 [Blomia tropicalis]
MFGTTREPVIQNEGTTLEEARRLANERTKQVQQKHQIAHDAKHPDLHFNIGDAVLRQIPDNHPSLDKLSPRWEGPYSILNRLMGGHFKFFRTLLG